MTRDLAAARAALLAPLGPLRRDSSGEPTLAELRFAIRRRQQEDFHLLHLLEDEQRQWATEGRRGAASRAARYRRLLRDLIRIHEAEREAWGIDSESDMFDEIVEKPSRAELIAMTMQAVRVAVARVKAMEAAAALEREAARSEPRQLPCGRGHESASGQDALRNLGTHDAKETRGGEESAAGARAVPEARGSEGADRPAGLREDGSPGATVAYPSTPRTVADMARFTRDSPMIPPPPPALFVTGRFAGGVPTFDPSAAIRDFKRRERQFGPGAWHWPPT